MSSPFSHLTELYDAMIDWNRRLANESPLYRWLLARVAAGNAADVEPPAFDVQPPMCDVQPTTPADIRAAGSGVQPPPGSDAESSSACAESSAAEGVSQQAQGGASEGRFRRLRVLDAACGTGRHALLFYRWGLEVEAADVSPEMVDFARGQFGEPPGLRWVVRGFEQPVETARPFDLAICVGNSLALAPDEQTARQAIGRMLSAVRPGGLLLVHLLNLWRLSDGPTVWQKCQRSRLSCGEVLIIKGVRRCGDRGAVELLVIGLPQAELLHAESAPLLGLTAEMLRSAAARAGASTIEFYGGYDRQPYQPEQSIDLLMVAVK